MIKPVLRDDEVVRIEIAATACGQIAVAYIVGVDKDDPGAAQLDIKGALVELLEDALQLVSDGAVHMPDCTVPIGATVQ